ncbi:MAG: tripartite tricarboxylate transporter substrate binding protein [Pseudomonadota bacterium]
MFRIAFLALFLATSAVAQDWPSKQIHLVVPFSAGGFADSSARAISERLSARLGQPVVIENRVGAGGNIGAEAVAKAAPDGHTLLLGFDGAMVINPHVYARMPVDTLRDFAPVTKLGDAAVIVVAHPSVQAKDLRELIALAKAKPGVFSYGTSGTGGTPHLVGEMVNQRAGTDFLHIPYKGGSQAVADAVGGQIPLVFTAIASAHQFLRSGKLKALGITSTARAPSMPEVPTFIESGLANFVVNSWIGVFAPAKTPRPIVQRLQREIAAVLKEPAVRERFAVLGIEPVGNSPEEYEAQVRADFALWEGVVKKAKIRIE